MWFQIPMGRFYADVRISRTQQKADLVVPFSQGADLAGEGRGGQDPLAAGGEQVGPGGAAAGVRGRGPRQGRGVGRPVRGDLCQDEG